MAQKNKFEARDSQRRLQTPPSHFSSMQLADLRKRPQLLPTVDDDEIECMLVRAQEMARYVEHGPRCRLTEMTGFSKSIDVKRVCSLTYSSNLECQ